MKLLTLYLLVFCTCSLGNVKAQKVSLHVSKASFQDVALAFQRQTGYSFSISNRFLSIANPVTLTLDKVDFDKAIVYLFRDQPFSYEVSGKLISVVGGVKRKHLPIGEQASQQQSISGRVTNDKDEPLAGVTVLVKGNSNKGTTTDSDGRFVLNGSFFTGVLVFQMVGYKTYEIEIEKQKVFDAILQMSESGLDEVVVVGYGTQKKSSVIGAISTLSPRNLKSPVAKISSQLAGQLAGVVAVQRSGEPGTGSTFWIRGISTFSGSGTPLVLVDGIERSIDLVDPEDIKEFSILKDAAATAIYGVRGANGVVIVTTRSGEAGDPKISVRAEQGMVSPTRVPKMLNAVQYAEMYNDAAGFDYYTPEIMDKYKSGSDKELYPNVDWVNELYKKSSVNSRINANVSGGTKSVRYYVSGGYYGENGLFVSDNMKAYNTAINYRQFRFRSNLDVDIAKYTTVNINLATSFEKKNEPGTGGGTIWQYALQTPSNAFPMVYENGYLPGPGTQQGNNPYALLTQTGYIEKLWNNAQSLFGITQDFSEYITKGLKANVKFSFDALNYSRLNRTKAPEQWSANRNPDGEIVYNQLVKGQESLSYSEGKSGRRMVYLEGSINYARTFGVHSVSALALFQQSQRNEIGVEASIDALPYRNQGIAGRLTYDFDQRYFIEGNFGYNGSENFSRGNRFGLFPSVALGWIASNEKFFQPLTNTIDLLKFRGSYGLVGNDQIGGKRRFIYLATVEAGKDYRFGESATTYSSIRLGDWANENVGWETAHKMDVGIELSLFRKLKIQADYFRELRDGIFLERSAIPMYVGVTNKPWVNIGKMRNKGMDASVEYHQKVGEVDITARGNFTHARNVILNMDQPDWAYLYQNRTGQARYQPFGYVAVGLFKDQADVDSWVDQSSIGGAQPGDIKYLDLNGDGVINSFDQKAIGYTDIPETVYGFGASVAWKSFDLSVFCQGNANVQFSMRSNMTQAFVNTKRNESNAFADLYGNYWTPENREAIYPRLTTAPNANNDVPSTFWQVDGSYLRIKNVELGYTLPSKISKKIQSNGIRVYFSGVNVLTFSKFKLWDPDLQTGAATYPMNKVFNVGLSMGF
ncbi:SusC/RagA family TonB-linked outer membrane protein [Sphingobacterium faecale]|uniref:TonB-dependent receptor n=1 Tax=Sphingobacterium faecale TaxID=2803775 RepID=A0ABS1R3F6_9SPHI|nr:TonB-dependent receptor [Sphingobacterium faecale]MBL1409250.1 TonB-dependent receptor [Sphingobacterium faecale]